MKEKLKMFWVFFLIWIVIYFKFIYDGDDIVKKKKKEIRFASINYEERRSDPTLFSRSRFLWSWNSLACSMQSKITWQQD